MKYNSRFLCPRCRAFTGWGTSDMKQWSRARGHCHGVGGDSGCERSFSWPRRDDWKYFIRVGRYRDRVEYIRLNPPRTVRFTTRVFFGDLPVLTRAKGTR